MKDKISWLIDEKYGDLRKSEKKTADYLLEHLREVATMPMEQLALRCKVSQPTIMRTVKALGFGGYKDFCQAVLVEFAKNESAEDEDKQVILGYSLTKDDRPEDVPKKVVAAAVNRMQDNLRNLSIKSFTKLLECLKTANMIDIYSVENSNVTANDLLTKLLYLGFRCRHFDDEYHQRISAGNLRKGDVAIGISYSGASKETVEVMRLAKKSGATTVVLTNFQDSVISKYADILICTSQEQLFYGDVIFSRAAQLLIVDMIYMGMIALDYEYYSKELDRNGRVVRDKAYGNERKSV